MLNNGWAIIQVLGATLRISTPVLFAALGGLMSERSGVINIALEGLMLMGAFFASVIANHSQSASIGMLGGAAAGAVTAAVYAYFVIELKANQIVAGTAINLMAVGLTPILCKWFYDSTASTPSLPVELRFQSAPIWIAWGLVILIWYGLNHTPAGLWIRFAGEHPEALDSAGVRVRRVRWFSVLMSGILAGMGGSALSEFLSSSFIRGMTAGRGFMALAALVFGKWKPIPTALACLLFGFSDAMQIRLQGVVLWGTEPVPVQFIQILPYLVTILVLAGFVGRARAPKSLGVPFYQS